MTVIFSLRYWHVIFILSSKMSLKYVSLKNPAASYFVKCARFIGSQVFVIGIDVSSWKEDWRGLLALLFPLKPLEAHPSNKKDWVCSYQGLLPDTWEVFSNVWNLLFKAPGYPQSFQGLFYFLPIQCRATFDWKTCCPKAAVPHPHILKQPPFVSQGVIP